MSATVVMSTKMVQTLQTADHHSNICFLTVLYMCNDDDFLEVFSAHAEVSVRGPFSTTALSDPQIYLKSAVSQLRNGQSLQDRGLGDMTSDRFFGCCINFKREEKERPVKDRLFVLI